MYQNIISNMSKQFKNGTVNSKEFTIKYDDLEEIKAVLIYGETNEFWDTDWTCNIGKFGAYIITPFGYSDFKILRNTKDELINQISIIKDCVKISDLWKGNFR